MDCAILADYNVRLKESEKRNTYLDLPKKLWNMKVTVIPVVIGAPGTNPQKIGKRTGGLGNKRTNRDHPNCSCLSNSSGNPSTNPGGKNNYYCLHTSVQRLPRPQFKYEEACNER